MRFTRYELYLEDEPQNVGFIVGLNELFDLMEGDYDFIDEYIESLLEPFDDELPFPPSKLWRGSVCAFTEFGCMVFKDAIGRIIRAYNETPFEIRELIAEIDDDELDKLTYQDDYQVCIPIDLFNRIKRDVKNEMRARFAA